VAVPQRAVAGTLAQTLSRADDRKRIRGMREFEVTFPTLLMQLHQLEFDYDDGNGIDFEPYQEFQSAKDTGDWIKAWTGNHDLTGSEYRIFGQDGSGGYAAFWLVRDAKPILEQPIVFFGSEGEAGVVARDFYDYLWLLAAGIGPCEAVIGAEDEREPIAHFVAFAGKYAAAQRKTATEVLTAAHSEFPDFERRSRS
jgi:hypothetical protein